MESIPPRSPSRWTIRPRSLFPITDYASQITGIMTPAMDDVLTGKAPPESLTEANNQVNQLFEQR
jgi:hypothetical protein